MDERGRQQIVGRQLDDLELELWLDERDELGVGSEREGLELWHRDCERRVRDVDRDELDEIRDELARQRAEVGRLEVCDARILAQRAEQLAVAGVDRVDAARAVLEQNAREAASGGADVDRDAIDDARLERFDRGP